MSTGETERFDLTYEKTQSYYVAQSYVLILEEIQHATCPVVANMFCSPVNRCVSVYIESSKTSGAVPQPDSQPFPPTTNCRENCCSTPLEKH